MARENLNRAIVELDREVDCHLALAMREDLPHSVFEIEDVGGDVELPDGSSEEVRFLMLDRCIRPNGRFDYGHASPRFFVVECRDKQLILPKPARD